MIEACLSVANDILRSCPEIKPTVALVARNVERSGRIQAFITPSLISCDPSSQRNGLRLEYRIDVVFSTPLQISGKDGEYDDATAKELIQYIESFLIKWTNGKIGNYLVRSVECRDGIFDREAYRDGTFFAGMELILCEDKKRFQ